VTAFAKVSVSFGGEKGCIVRFVSKLLGMFTDDRMVSVASIVPAAKSKLVSFDNSLGEGAVESAPKGRSSAGLFDITVSSTGRSHSFSLTFKTLVWPLLVSRSIVYTTSGS
jgi:hypothetical protein